MSRPYLNINSATYSYTTDIVSMDITALRMRGVSSITLGGFSASRTISLSRGFYDNNTYTFSALLDGSTASATSSTTYVRATASITFTGTASTNTNIGFKLPSTSGSGNTILGAGGYTFSATQSLSAALNLLVGNMAFSGVASGFSATTSGNAIVFSAPSNTGVYYNGYSVTVDKQAGLGTIFTFSYGASFSKGSTTFALTLKSDNFGTLENFNFSV